MKKNPCQKGYEMIGTKNKNGKMVPNCVPKKNESIITWKNWLDLKETNKEDMPCNDPRPSTRPGKKRMVKACEDGKEKIVHYGAKGYGHNYSDAARKSFRARHKCGEKKSKLSAQYWACKDLWTKGGSKKSSPKSRKGKYSN